MPNVNILSLSGILYSPWLPDYPSPIGMRKFAQTMRRVGQAFQPDGPRRRRWACAFKAAPIATFLVLPRRWLGPSHALPLPTLLASYLAYGLAPPLRRPSPCLSIPRSLCLSISFHPPASLEPSGWCKFAPAGGTREISSYTHPQGLFFRPPRACPSHATTLWPA